MKLEIKKDSLGYETVYNYETGECIINLDRLKEGKINFNISTASFSGDSLLAVSYSEKGEISHHLIIRDIGQDTVIFEKAYVAGFCWASDSLILYAACDSTHRAYQVKSTNVYTGLTDLIYELEKEEFSLGLEKLEDEILLYGESKDLTWVQHYDEINHTFQPLLKPENNVYKSVNYYQNDSIIYTTSGNRNQILLTDQRKGESEAKELYQTSAEIDEIELTKDFMVFTEYEKGSYAIKTIEKSTNEVETLKGFPKYSVINVDSAELNTNRIIVTTASAIQSPNQYAINLKTGEKDTLESRLVKANYLAENYAYKYISIKTEEGVSVPVTILYNKTYKDSLKGMFINGYGAYGSRNTPYFNPADLIYANNGICVVHVFPRGSSEKGQQWYTDGKLLNKKNTFTDFIACTKALKKKYKLSQHQIIGRGGSAGGILIGAVANSEPDLFGGLILDRPAIDVTGFMSNPKLPLTTGEYNEWGNITDSTYYNYIQSYSPLGNIKKQNYPNLLILGKYHDMHTPYWDIAEATVKYRSAALNDPLILMGTDLKAGHLGNVNYMVELDYAAATYAFMMYTIESGEE